MARFHIDGGPLDLGEGAKAPPGRFRSRKRGSLLAPHAG